MKAIAVCGFLMCASLSACGGGGGGESGVEGSKAITELDAGEVSTFCEWLIELSGGENQVTECPGGFTWDTGTVAECEAGFGSVPAACSTVTVAEMEACGEAMADDPCTGIESQVCAEYFECAFQGQ